MLEGRLVRLEPLEVADVNDEYVNWFNDPVTFRYLGTKFGQTRTSVRRYVESITPPNLACKIVWREEGRHVGNISLYSFDPVHRVMELGIVIGDARVRGHGVGKEACSLLIQYAFDHLNVRRITAGTVVDNVAMKKAFLALGFKVEGTLRAQYYLEGRYHDIDRFGLLKDEFLLCH